MRKLNLTSSALVLLSISSFVLLTACSSDGEERHEYLDAASVKSLEIPPKLTMPDTSNGMVLPQPSDTVKNAFENSQGAKAIAPEFKGMRLQHDSRLYWLEIDEPVERVWASLPSFLATEGMEVDRVERLLGFVDTKWMNEYQITYGGKDASSSWFSGFTPDYKDKFRIRVETEDADKTRLFISHRGVELIVKDEGTSWQQRESESLLEREIMYRYALFAGASKHAATDLLSGYQSYQPRVRLNEDDVSTFEVLGDKDTVWLRLNIAMDRLGVDTIKTDKAKGSLEVRVGNISIDTDEIAEESEGLFAGLFGGSEKVEDVFDMGSDDVEISDDEAVKTSVKEEDKFIIHVQQQAGEYSSTIKLSRTDNSPVESGGALDFRNALVKQLK